MDDIRKNAERRAANPNSTPAGASFETERQKQKAALVRQLDELDPSRVRKISAYSETADANKVLRVAAYCRVSTDDIDQAISISLQMRQYKEKIQANPNWKYAGTYVDNGFSGTNTAHRPGFLKLVEDARAGKIDMIITKAVSRFARNLLDCIGYIEEFKNLDPPIRVFFEQENLDTGLQTSGIILFVLAMVAEEESHMKSEAMLLSLEWRFSRGRFLTPALFGYDKVETIDSYGGKRKVLQINQPQAQVVKWMYATLLNGGTPDEIAARLTELQIPTGGRKKNGAMNNDWSRSGVTVLMRNERYCGDVLARKTYTPNFKDHKSKKNNGKKNKYFQPDHHDAIVTRAVWNAAQRILNSRRFHHEGEYLPMSVIDHGILTGFISMNRSWAGYEADDYFRIAQIAMGILEDEIESDLENEYIPDAGHRLGGMIDDHGISRIARELTEAEQQIKDELEGKDRTEQDLLEQAEIINAIIPFTTSIFENSRKLSETLIDFLKSSKSTFTISELKERSGVSSNGIHNFIRKFLQSGMIKSDNNGYYFCTRSEERVVRSENRIINDSYSNDVLQLIHELCTSRLSTKKDIRIGNIIRASLDRGIITVEDYDSINESAKMNTDMLFASQLGLVQPIGDKCYRINKTLTENLDGIEKGTKTALAQLYKLYGESEFSVKMVIADLDYSKSHVNATLHRLTWLKVLNCKVDENNKYIYQFLVTPEDHPECFGTAA